MDGNAHTGFARPRTIHWISLLRAILTLLRATMRARGAVLLLLIANAKATPDALGLGAPQRASTGAVIQAGRPVRHLTAATHRGVQMESGI